MRQVHWYMKQVEGTRGQLEEMHAWLEKFILDVIVRGQKFGREEEDEFETKARNWCPEDESEWEGRGGGKGKGKEGRRERRARKNWERERIRVSPQLRKEYFGYRDEGRGQKRRT
jgi:hypothetical protein